MTTAKALQFTKAGEPTEVLSWSDASLPAEPAAGFIRVKVAARPINPADGLFVAGHYGVKPKLEAGAVVAGAEGAGVVVALGAGTDAKFKVGQRVFFALGFDTPGSYAELADVPAAGIVAPLPDAVPFSAASQLFVNPLTALGFLSDMADGGLAEGEAFLFTAAGSALGRIVIQLAAKRGYKVIAQVRRAEQVAQLKELGAAVVVNTGAGESIVDAVKAATDGKGVKFAIDAVGGGDISQAAIESLASGGSLFVYGVLHPSGSIALNSGALIFKQATVRGWWLNGFVGKNFARLPQLFGDLLTAIADGSLKLASKEFDIATQWKDAFAHSVSAGKNEKSVLVSKVE